MLVAAAYHYPYLSYRVIYISILKKKGLLVHQQR